LHVIPLLIARYGELIAQVRRKQHYVYELIDPIMVFFFILLAYCALSIFYLFILSVWGRFFYSPRKWTPANMATALKIAILVPAYKEDEVIGSTADNLLALDYPRDKYDIYIIADSFRPETLRKLEKMPLTVLEVAFENSTKTKALNEAFLRIDKKYDIALICDGDNMLDGAFLKKINDAFVGGARAVQGRRVAKNLDSSFAILDACSEGINNHIFRKGTNALGLSSAISGSGMAFQYDLVKEILGEIDAVGGFDKVLQLKVVKRRDFIYYLDDAIAYDEKVDSPVAFSQQRKRWMSSQFVYARRYFFPAFRQVFKGNMSYFNLAVANYSLLPKAFLMVLLPVLAVAGFYLQPVWGFVATGLFGLYFMALLMALPSVLINADLFQAVLSLPRAVVLMFGALWQSKKANQRFIHTPHTKTGITHPGKTR
jgi:cellulose synthase/poly-beta-1,6-N-acetylglucosamine synthase-like glycosyltransferase